MRATLIKLGPATTSAPVQGKVYGFVALSSAGPAPGCTWTPNNDKTYPLTAQKFLCDNLRGSIGGKRNDETTIEPLPWNDVVFFNNDAINTLFVAVALSPAQADSLPEACAGGGLASTNGNQVTVVGGGLTVVGGVSTGVPYDVTSGAGAAQDTGVVGWAGTTSQGGFEMVASAALTGSRTIDVRMVRGDATQFSFFDPIRNTAATFALAIGRVNWLGMLGLAGAQAPAAAAAGAGWDWSCVMPFVPTGGIRAVITAGGAESIRLRVFQRFGQGGAFV